MYAGVPTVDLGLEWSKDDYIKVQDFSAQCLKASKEPVTQ